MKRFLARCVEEDVVGICTLLSHFILEYFHPTDALCLVHQPTAYWVWLIMNLLYATTDLE